MRKWARLVDHRKNRGAIVDVINPDVLAKARALAR